MNLLVDLNDKTEQQEPFQLERWNQISQSLSSFVGHKHIVRKCLSMINGQLEQRQQKWHPNLKDLLPKSVVFHGSARNGKTMLVYALANHFKFNMISVSSLTFGQTDEKPESVLEKLFEFAVKNGPTIIFFDNIHLTFDRAENNLYKGKILHYF